MKRTESRNLVIISGPSGVGKGTVISALLSRHTSLSLAISATTRAPRASETNGQQYYFLSKDTFKETVDQDGFLEWCEVHGNYYGTLKSEIQRLQDLGKTVILEIDTQGAEKIKASVPNCIFIFIEPPSMSELETRLKTRGTEDSESVARRIVGAKAEMEAKANYDHRVINSTVESAVQQIESILFFQEVPK
ncbi:guanylate kinase [bacterium]|nr:guanylate kinase [bacterium]